MYHRFGNDASPPRPLARLCGARACLVRRGRGRRLRLGRTRRRARVKSRASPRSGRHRTRTSGTAASRTSEIDSGNVDELGIAWTIPIQGGGTFGNYASTPIIADGVVYTQDLTSNVKAIDLESGDVKWSRDYDSPTVGPNGVTIGYDKIYGATSEFAFALEQGHRRRGVALEEADPEPERGHRHGARQSLTGRCTSRPCPGTRSRSTRATAPGCSGRSTRRRARRSGSSGPSRGPLERPSTRTSTAAAASGIHRRSTTTVTSTSPWRTRRPGRVRTSSPGARAGRARTRTRTRSSS